MKRRGNLYHLICDIDNLILAEKKASKNKSKQRGVKWFNKNKDMNILMLNEALINKTFKTSEYTIFKIFDPKEREIYKLPYYPDRIVHHAIMNILESIFVDSFTKDTYNCIKKRGIHGALNSLTKSLKDETSNLYCLKLDIRKFYPSIDHDILKLLLRRKFKDKDLLWILDEIVDSTKGIPIGNYLSQYFGNFYLNYFDHYIKEELGVKHYLRYCDDIVITHNSKEYLRFIFNQIRVYLKDKLKLDVKSNYQIFLIRSRGIDFVGYKSYVEYIELRDSIKRKIIRMLRYNRNIKSIASYNGWLIHCNSINFRRKYNLLEFT